MEGFDKQVTTTTKAASQDAQPPRAASQTQQAETNTQQHKRETTPNKPPHKFRDGSSPTALAHLPLCPPRPTCTDEAGVQAVTKPDYCEFMPKSMAPARRGSLGHGAVTEVGLGT